MANLETATLGGGCFWCLEAVYQEIRGVKRIVSGYAGGHVVNPTYEQVCGKQTGHTEVVQVEFDPDVVSYRDLLNVFFVVHDPTTPNRQGNDVGPQYRSAVYTHSDEQLATVQEAVADVNGAGWYSAPIVTEIGPIDVFYPAEAYHQNYYKNNPYAGYCMFVVRPKVSKARKHFVELLKK